MPYREEKLHLPQAILFDMDGTLIDSEPFWQAAEYEVVESGGGIWTHEQALTLVGFDLMDAAHVLIAAGAPGSPEDVVAFLVERVSTQLRREVPWREHAAETLAWVRALGIPCALVTSSYGPVAHAFADTAAPGTFEVVVSGDVVERGKPHPDPYLQAARALGVDATQCIAVEDSRTGITAALAAGARTIGIEAITPVESAPGLSRIKSLDQLTPSVLDVVMRGGLIDFNS
jgi:HAD superfamily hydrolase (TIGR01509 family)